MKRLLVLTLLGAIVGCGPTPKARPKNTIDEERLGRAREAFNVFFAEALKGAEMLETPATTAVELEAQAKKTREALEKADVIYPSLKRVKEASDEAKGTMRFFTKSLEMLRIRDRNPQVSEKARAGYAGACRQNGEAVRKMVDRIRGKI